MRTLSRSSNGHVSFLFVSLLVVVLAGISYAAVHMVHKKQTPTASLTTRQTPATTPSTIRSKADLIQAANALKSDTTNTQLDPNQLNDDLTSLL